MFPRYSLSYLLILPLPLSLSFSNSACRYCKLDDQNSCTLKYIPSNLVRPMNDPVEFKVTCVACPAGRSLEVRSERRRRQGEKREGGTAIPRRTHPPTVSNASMRVWYRNNLDSPNLVYISSSLFRSPN